MGNKLTNDFATDEDIADLFKCVIFGRCVSVSAEQIKFITNELKNAAYTKEQYKTARLFFLHGDFSYRQDKLFISDFYPTEEQTKNFTNKVVVLTKEGLQKIINDNIDKGKLIGANEERKFWEQKMIEIKDGFLK